MYIHEAIKVAMEKDSAIRRDPASAGNEWAAIAILPTNTIDRCCIIRRDGAVTRIPDRRDAHRCWKPSADDLLAEDWQLTNIPVNSEMLKRIRAESAPRSITEPPSGIPYSYLGEIQMNFVFTKVAVGFSLIALILSLITLLGK